MFDNHYTQNEKDQQGYYTQLGFMPRFNVYEPTQESTGCWTVMLKDEAKTGLDKVEFFVFSSFETAQALFDLMDQEVKTWDCSDYYDQDDKQRAEQEQRPSAEEVARDRADEMRAA